MNSREQSRNLTTFQVNEAARLAAKRTLRAVRFFTFNDELAKIPYAKAIKVPEEHKKVLSKYKPSQHISKAGWGRLNGVTRLVVLI